MARKLYTPEEVVGLLPQIEVATANRSTINSEIQIGSSVHFGSTLGENQGRTTFRNSRRECKYVRFGAGGQQSRVRIFRIQLPA